jgi:hypothetical protein
LAGADAPPDNKARRPPVDHGSTLVDLTDQEEVIDLTLCST